MPASSVKTKVSVGSIVLVILFLLVVVSAGLAVYFYRQVTDLKEDPQKVASEEVRAVVARVSEIMVLPEEEPTLATVTAPERLQDQPFFARAKVGDKVLLYANAKKAILYDPAAHKIVEVAPLNIGDSPAPAVASASAASSDVPADTPAPSESETPPVDAGADEPASSEETF